MARSRKRKGLPIHGWLAVDKPVDVTSTQVVGKIKWLFKAQKAGHGGTLDPLADGILPIALGEATKTAQWAMDGDKEYVFTVQWGVSTESYDREGAVVARSDVRPDREAIEGALPDFLGEIDQVPPRFSAIKVDGERAYDLARDGENFELPSRKVEVFEAELVDLPDPDHARFRVVSGKGFYVRAMARDLAEKLGTEGHVTALRRTRVGALDEARAVPLSKLVELEGQADALEAFLLPIHAVLEDVPSIEIDRSEAADLRQGREIVLLPHIVEAWKADPRMSSDDRMAVALLDGVAVAMGEIRAGRFSPKRVFQIET